MTFSYLGMGFQCDLYFKIVKYIDVVSRRTPLFLKLKLQKGTQNSRKQTLSRATTSNFFFLRGHNYFKSPDPWEIMLVIGKPTGRSIMISSPLTISSKFSEKGVSHSPIPIPRAQDLCKGMNSAVRTDFLPLLLNWYKKHVRFVFRACFGTVLM